MSHTQKRCTYRWCYLCSLCMPCLACTLPSLHLVSVVFGTAIPTSLYVFGIRSYTCICLYVHTAILRCFLILQPYILLYVWRMFLYLFGVFHVLAQHYRYCSFKLPSESSKQIIDHSSHNYLSRTEDAGGEGHVHHHS